MSKDLKENEKKLILKYPKWDQVSDSSIKEVNSNSVIHVRKLSVGE